MEWISVKDKLPIATKENEDDKYLVLVDRSCEYCVKWVPHGHIMSFKRFQYDISRWNDDEKWFSESYLGLEVTHWMSFPQTPKKE